MASADELLTAPAIEAGVNALALRNQHHLEGMDPAERASALGHWRELALEVLHAAADALAAGPGGPGSADRWPGRAVIVLEDEAEDSINIAVSFAPDIQYGEDDQVVGTLAQVTAISLLEQLQGEADGPEA